MLRGSNDKELIEKGIKKEIIPFYQIWQELVNVKTLDVYQYRILTSLSALKELAEVLKKTLEGLFNSDANIDACREETLYILSQDLVMEKYYKPVLGRLKFSLGNKPKTVAEKNRLLHQLKYIIDVLEPDYLENTLMELENSIKSGELKRIEFYANTVASQAVYNGWSAHALFDLLRLFSTDKDFDLQWKDFKGKLLNEKRTKHDVLINIPFKKQAKEEQVQTLEALHKLGINIKGYGEIICEFSDVQDIEQRIKSDKRYFHISVEAYDIYTAAHMAIREISEQLNMASFYNLVSAWDLSSVVILSINSISKYHRAFPAEQLYQTYDYIDSSGKIFDNTRKIFQDKNKSKIREKLQGAFGYTNISRASLFQEEKYMNLWVSLESLARTDMYSDIISNVKETVPAALSLRYVYRIVRNYVEDCNRCGVKLDFSNNRSIDMKQDTKQKMVCEMIEIFQDETLYTALLEKCDVNSLLKYRTESVYMLLNNIEIVKNKVENHYNKVKWQIQRLYRIRNEIAHAALRERASLIVYIEHLYDYLSTYIIEIVTCLAENGQDNIEEALCFIKDNYEIFVEYAKNKENEVLKNSILKTGIINLITKGD